MSRELQQPLLDALDYLMTLSQESVQPAEAKAGLRFLQKQYPETGMELLWEEEAYDQSIHYDVLLSLAGKGTVSLSFCPDRALPWPLRGVNRWREMDLARVNNTILRAEQAIACLDFIWEEAPIINRLVNTCLIQEALEQDPIELCLDDRQLAIDAFRRRHKLYTAKETYRWMERHGMTHEKLEHYVTDEAVAAKLRDRVAVAQVSDYFESHRADFDTAYIAQLTFPEEENALLVWEQIRTGRLGFYEAAQRLFLTRAEQSEKPLKDIFTVAPRRQLSPELAEAVFAAAPGEVVGPVPIDEGYVIVQVLSVVPGCLDNSTSIAIKNILFEQWLEERRQAATIEWY
jgi:putative peptide maturation system protein